MFIQKKGGSSKRNYSFSVRDKKRFIGDVKLVRVKNEEDKSNENVKEEKKTSSKKFSNNKVKENKEE